MRASPILLLSVFALFLGTKPVTGQTPAQTKSTIVSRIPREPVDSSAIAAVGYSKKLHALEVEFVNGAVYRYLEVPVTLHRNLMAADSKARFYDKNIRARYRSVHVKPRKKK